MDRGRYRIAFGGDRLEDGTCKSKIGKLRQGCNLSKNRMRPNRRAAFMRRGLAGRETTRVKRVVRASQTYRPNPVPNMVVGSLTRIRSRDSKDEHERCVLYMSVALPMVKA